MNRYFLLIACLQLWPTAAPVSPVTIWTPLLIAMLLTAAKAAYDDIRRWRRDRTLNEKRIECLDGTFTASKNIRVGDVICVREDEEFPCDLLLLASSGPQGHALMMTANIDGETDLKHRHVPRQLLDAIRASSSSDSNGRSSSSSSSSTGLIERRAVERWLKESDISISCPHPNAKFDAFNAKLAYRTLADSQEPVEMPLSHENLLLQCCHLKKTAWVCGIAVYTGNETKCGENKGYPKLKRAQADKLIDRIALTIFVFQLIIMAVFGVAALISRSQELSAAFWYLRHPAAAQHVAQWIVLPIRFLLLTSYMVPISLKVQLDFTKLVYALFINSDVNMYDPETDTPANAQNSSISEDLGKVEYVLTDKTGTLTVNSMSFERCSIRGRLYGLHGEGASIYTDKGLANSLRERDGDTLQFFRIAALCHTCIVDRDKHGNIRYNSSSPDEEALVYAARQFGVELMSTDADSFVLSVLSQSDETYDLLQTLRFTSERKRMSAIVRQRETGRIWIVSKGADDVMLQRIARGQEELCETTEQHLSIFGKSGLRTLVVAWRELSILEYSNWCERYDRANVSMGDRQRELCETYELIERDLTLLGATAIEDKLQEHVPETISMLRRADIGVWMLTGDKFETAKQIAISCGLLDGEEQLFQITGPNHEDLRDMIHGANDWAHQQTTSSFNYASSDITFDKQQYSIIVSGDALDCILSSSKTLFPDTYAAVPRELSGLADRFVNLARMARSVVCCRVTPRQKASIVTLVKDLGKITLAIGDGGNDVPMIQEAHVGVGITGKEGLEAARASDFSFSRFRFLVPLIFAHGHYSYLRTSLLAQFSFYKNIMLAVMQVLFNAWTHFSGLSPYNDMSLALYNVMWTSLYTFTIVLDRDVDYEELIRRPRLYRYTSQRAAIGARSVAQWLVLGFAHALAILLLSIYCYQGGNPSIDTEYFGNVIYTIALWVDVLIFALFTKSFNVISTVTIVGTMLGYFVFMLLFNLMLPVRLHWGPIFQLPAIFKVYGVWNKILTDPLFYLTSLLCIAVCLLPPFALRYVRQQLFPNIIERYLRAKQHHGLNSIATNLISDYVPYDSDDDRCAIEEYGELHRQTHYHKQYTDDEYSADSTTGYILGGHIHDNNNNTTPEGL